MDENIYNGIIARETLSIEISFGKMEKTNAFVTSKLNWTLQRTEMWNRFSAEKSIAVRTKTSNVPFIYSIIWIKNRKILSKTYQQ